MHFHIVQAVASSYITYIPTYLYISLLQGLGSQEALHTSQKTKPTFTKTTNLTKNLEQLVIVRPVLVIVTADPELPKPTVAKVLLQSKVHSPNCLETNS